MAAVARRQFCGKLHVITPQAVQWKPRLRKAAGTLCAMCRERRRESTVSRKSTVRKRSGKPYRTESTARKCSGRFLRKVSNRQQPDNPTTLKNRCLTFNIKKNENKIIIGCLLHCSCKRMLCAKCRYTRCCPTFRQEFGKHEKNGYSFRENHIG